VCNREAIQKLAYFVNYDGGREEKIIEKVYRSGVEDRRLWEEYCAA